MRFYSLSVKSLPTLNRDRACCTYEFVCDMGIVAIFIAIFSASEFCFFCNVHNPHRAAVPTSRLGGAESLADMFVRGSLRILKAAIYCTQVAPGAILVCLRCTLV